MDSNLFALALFLCIIIGIYVYSEKEVTAKVVEVHVCKDMEKRVFFMGEEDDFKRMQKLDVFDIDTCVVKQISGREWRTLRIRHRHSHFFF